MIMLKILNFLSFSKHIKHYKSIVLKK